MPTRASILEVTRILERIVEEYDDDPRGCISETRSSQREIERLISGHPRAAEMLRHVRNGAPILALGVAQAILQGLPQEAA